MKIAVMQPYFFPYIGYFQLAAAVDRWVFLDDVAYQRGWMNRNRLLINGEVRYITVPLRKASQNKSIDEIQIDSDQRWQSTMSRSVAQAYQKAPYFKSAFALFQNTLEGSGTSLAALAKSSVCSVARYLGLTTEFVDSSRRYHNADLTGESRILDIACREGATEYHNLPGGVALYHAENFAARGISLHFVEPTLITYPQHAKGFQPWLSILDVLMFNSVDSVRAMLQAPRTADEPDWV